MATLEYDYRPKAWVMVLAGGFFAACAWFMADKAASNDSGLVINYVVELGVSGASMFFWALFGACVVFVLAAAFGLYVRMGRQRRVILMEDSLQVPDSWRSEAVRRIALDDIEALQSKAVQTERFLEIGHGGRKTTLTASHFPSAADFDTFTEQLVARITARRNVAPG